MDYLFSLFEACLLTIVIELPVQFVGFKSVQRKYKTIVFVLTNVITNLTLNLVLTFLRLIPFFRINMVYLLLVCFLEVAVVFSEAFIYRDALKTQLKKSILVSTVANVLSFGLGMIIFPLWGK